MLNVVQSGIMFMGISLGVMACTAGVAKVGYVCVDRQGKAMEATGITGGVRVETGTPG